MQFLHFTISDEPVGRAYECLIDFCAAHCDRFSLISPSVETSSSRQTLSLLHPFLLMEANVKEWPGTRYGGDPKRLVLFTAAPSAVEILKGRVRSLYEWQFIDLPEDLAFYREGGSVFLATVSHEGFGDLYLTKDEKESLAHLCPEIRLEVSTHSRPGNAPIAASRKPERDV